MVAQQDSWPLVHAPSAARNSRVFDFVGLQPNVVRQNAVQRFFSDIVTHLKLWRATHVGAAPRVYGNIWIHGGGKLFIGDHVVLDARSCPIELRITKGAELYIGNNTVIKGGASIEATSKVSIGANCKIESYCKILDNNLHPLRGNRHETPKATPVEIEEGVHIGSRSILLPGARVGAHTTILADTVISRPLPAGVTVAGYPPKLIKRASNDG